MSCPDIASLLVYAAQTALLPPDLVAELHAHGTAMQLVLRCSALHPEVCCRARLLWQIVPHGLANGVTALVLRHRNRHGANGWHEHSQAQCSLQGVQQLLSHVRRHDAVLYRTASAVSPSVGAGVD